MSYWTSAIETSSDPSIYAWTSQEEGMHLEWDISDLNEATEEILNFYAEEFNVEDQKYVRIDKNNVDQWQFGEPDFEEGERFTWPQTQEIIAENQPDLIRSNYGRDSSFGIVSEYGSKDNPRLLVGLAAEDRNRETVQFIDRLYKRTTTGNLSETDYAELEEEIVI